MRNPAFRCQLFLVALILATISSQVQEQSASTFPNQPIRIIVPTAAGGTADAYARLLGKAAGEILGSPS